MTETTEASGTGWYTRFVGLAAVALAVLVVLLGLQNHRLKQQLAAAVVPAPPALEAGEILGPIELVDEAGESRSLTAATGGGRALVLLFTPTCPACRETLPVWSELVRSFDGSAPIVLAVNLAPPGSPGGDDLVTAGLPFPVFGVEHEASTGLRKISHVPATVILDAGGRVEHAWFGQLDDRLADELRAALRG